MAKKVTYSPLFSKYQKRYNRGGCTKEQLAKLVTLGVLTTSEYKEITGETYKEETE